jgi:hypothetical protein
LSPLGTAATNKLIVPAPGNYDDAKIGGMTGRGNRSTRIKSAPCRLVHHKPHMLLGLLAWLTLLRREDGGDMFLRNVC